MSHGDSEQVEELKVQQLTASTLEIQARTVANLLSTKTFTASSIVDAVSSLDLDRLVVDVRHH
jgi:hypothetical protein